MAAPVILFVFPAYSGKRQFSGFDYHLGTGYIRAYLAGKGIQTAQFIDRGDADYRELARRMLDFGARVIGFSCYDNAYVFVRRLATEIRRLSPDVRIVCGGPSATFSFRTVLRDCPAIDVCARSYAEISASRLVEWARGDRSLDTIPGIAFRDSRGRVSATPDAGLFPDAAAEAMGLDFFPDPYVAGVIPPERASDIGVITSRGCSFPCAFCNCSAMSGRRVYFHSVKRIMSVLAFLNKTQKARSAKLKVAFVDDHLALDVKRFEALLDEMMGAPFDCLEFWAEMRPESLEKRHFDMMRAAGFREVHFGLESGSPKILAAMQKIAPRKARRKGFDLEKRYLKRLKTAVRRASAAGLQTSVSAIFGCPGETVRDAKATLDMVRALKADRYAHNYLRVLPGAALADPRIRRGLGVKTIKNMPLPWKTVHAYDVFRLPVLPNDHAVLPEAGVEWLNAVRVFAGTLPPVLLNDSVSGVLGQERLLVLSPKFFKPEILEGLTMTLAPATAIWVSYSGEYNRDIFVEKLACAGIPAPDVNTLREIRRPGCRRAWRINEQSLTAPDENVYILRAAPWRTALRPQAKTGRRRSMLLLEADKPGDFAALLESAIGFERSGRLRLAPGLAAQRPAIRDECRWCSLPCAGLALERMFLDPAGNIRLCHGGPTIGAVRDSMQTLAARARSLIAQTRERRGCASCPADGRCSICMNPAPMGEKEYCEIRRAHPGLAGIADTLRAVRRLAFFEVYGNVRRACTLSIPGSDRVVARRGKRLPVEECLLLEFENEPFRFIFHSRSNFLYAASPLEEWLWNLGKIAGKSRKRRKMEFSVIS